jgi:DNA-binding protein HU-beta
MQYSRPFRFPRKPTSELVAKIAETNSVSKTQAEAIVDSMLKSIMSAAAKGEEISLPGFGKFKVKETPEREGVRRQRL